MNPILSYEKPGNRNNSVCDAPNRMTSFSNSSGTMAYTYRADGMRTKKVSSSGSTSYLYDGQMGIEDIDVAGSTYTYTDYALGGRGVEMMTRTVGSTVTQGYPIYDAHGNMVATLTKGSGSTYSVNDRRSYDAWGIIRQGATTADPKGRYCASLGHKQDDESGLVYIRARYYEPNSGRFISQDKQLNGFNWIIYSGNDPVNKIDWSGYDAESYRGWLLTSAIFAGIAGLLYEDGNVVPALQMLGIACSAAAKALGESGLIEKKFQEAIWLTGGICTLTGILEGKRWLDRDARTRILADITAVYLLEIVAALAFITYDSM